MSPLEILLGRERLLLAVALSLSAIGLLTWLTMPRQEDPRLPELWGQVVVSWPGADALDLERLVVEPIEDALAEVEELKRIEVQVRAEVTSMELELRGDITDTDRAWDEVEDALAEAQREFPPGVETPVLNRDIQDVEAVLLAIGGSDDLIHLADVAEDLRERLLKLSLVKRVTVIGDPGDQVTVALEESVARRYGLTLQAVAAQLTGQNRAAPGGSIVIGEKQVTLRPQNEFTSLAELATIPIRLPTGTTLPLSQIAQISRTPVTPPSQRMRVHGQPVVGLGVVPRNGINSVEFGRQVRQAIAEGAPHYLPLTVQELNFQPDQVAARINGLQHSLLSATLVVGLVLLVTMGPRLGLLVAAGVPLVMLSAILLYALGGGVLHQMSVAALVISLGILVDNGIVVAEGIQSRLNEGMGAAAAALATARELAVPLASATGTTMATFLPMLLSTGPTAAFTSAIPVVVMLTLSLSYLFAMGITPVLARRFLRPAPVAEGRLTHLARAIARLGVGHPWMVLLLAVVALGLSLAGLGQVHQQFFPVSDRNDLLVELKLPEGSHLSAVEPLVTQLEPVLLARPEVTQVASYLGRSVPHFYYNLPQEPHNPHAATLVVTTTNPSTMGELEAWLHPYLADNLPQAEVVIRHIEQGPPVKAPIEVRLHGDDLEELAQAVQQVFAVVATTPGTRDARHNLGVGVPTLRIIPHDATAATLGLDRGAVADTLYARSRGLLAGYYRAGDEPVPILVRPAAGEQMTVEQLRGITLFNAAGDAIPLAQVATLEPDWQPALITRRARERVVTISAQLAGGVAFSEVLAQLKPRLATLQLPTGVHLSYGGDAEGAGEANAALVSTMPLGAVALIAILIAQFNSFRRVALVLLTIPLAAAGIVPGLLLGQQPFGFMSLLGVFALAGVVVNNAIVLIDRVEQARVAGGGVVEALQGAVVERFRPILLTSITTVAGLLPLALTPSPLWPPMAWAMISGLTASTALTLLVVPALYRLLFAPRRPPQEATAPL